MHREQRKKRVQTKLEAQNDAPSRVSFSEEGFQKAFEAKQRSSELRFEKLASPEMTTVVLDATRLFAEREKLSVTMVSQATDIPRTPPGVVFNYSPGSLEECVDRLAGGEHLVTSLVWEEKVLIGYGIAVKKGDEFDIEIIDVDLYSRRLSGFLRTLQMENETFEIGVGHVVAAALVKRITRPIKVDAKNNVSRYVFKSLGFQHDDRSNNPCILRLE